jgi:hypothetical protein
MAAGVYLWLIPLICARSRREDVFIGWIRSARFDRVNGCVRKQSLKTLPPMGGKGSSHVLEVIVDGSGDGGLAVF